LERRARACGFGERHGAHAREERGAVAKVAELSPQEEQLACGLGVVRRGSVHGGHRCGGSREEARVLVRRELAERGGDVGARGRTAGLEAQCALEERERLCDPPAPERGAPGALRAAPARAVQPEPDLSQGDGKSGPGRQAVRCGWGGEMKFIAAGPASTEGAGADLEAPLRPFGVAPHHVEVPRVVPERGARDLRADPFLVLPERVVELSLPLEREPARSPLLCNVRTATACCGAQEERQEEERALDRWYQAR